MKRLLTFLMAASAAGAIAAPIAMAQDPRPGYGYGIVTCSTSSNGFQFQNSSRSSALSRNEILQQCSNDSRTSNDECSANVYCDDDFNPAPMIQCSTSSNGQQFQDESRNPLIARQHAMSACSNDSHTSNDECSANAACTNENPAPMVTCSTFSRGINFSDESRNPEVAKSHAVSACQNDSRTTNQECSVNVACNMPSSPYPQPQPYPGQPYPQPQPQPYPGQPYPQPANPVITCSTSSNGLNFENSSRDSNFSRQDAIRQCTGDSRTSNDECQANSICTDDYNPAPMIQCSTFSRGINFSDESRNPQIARSHAVSTCQSDSRTSNSECSVNVACFDPNPNPTYVPNPNPYPTYVPGPGHGPGPGPGPGGPGPGNPYPNPTLYTCTASTNQGQYIGTAPSPEQATAYARDNCLRAETSFRCNAASIVCRH